ncbi:MAG: hypothetical protein WBG92_23770 [Thiohalocapsa sp.]
MDSAVSSNVGVIVFTLLVLGVLAGLAVVPGPWLRRRNEDDPLYHTHEYERSRTRAPRRTFIVSILLLVAAALGVWLAVPEDTLATGVEHVSTALLLVVLPGATLALGLHISQVSKLVAPGAFSAAMAVFLVVLGVIWLVS